MTLDDVHYVREGDSLVPAAETPFAADKGFGFRSSNLREWIAEKFEGDAVPPIESISIDALRARNGAQEVATQLKSIISRHGSAGPRPVIILNGFSNADFQVFVAGVREAGDPRFLYRTGASFVSNHLGITKIPPIPPAKLFPTKPSRPVGGLIIVGSYVPKTTAQREVLLTRCQEHLTHFELDVERLLSAKDKNEALIRGTVKEIERTLECGKDAVLSTSRKLITSDDKRASLEMGKIVSGVLNAITKAISVRPRYVIAKVSRAAFH